MIDVRFVTKDWFFDRPKVINATDRITRRALSRFGAFTMTRAKRSIRKRKAVSKPGSPPSSRTGLLRQFIYFGYDPIASSVVIGPAAINGKMNDGSLVGVNTVPELLEYGGGVRLHKDRVIRNRGGVDRIPAGTLLTYKARPYMRPAFDAELDNLPAIWQRAAG